MTSKLAPAPGVVISRATLEGRWLYSELNSSRLGEARRQKLQSEIDQQIFDAATAAIPFENLSEDDQARLSALAPLNSNQLIGNLAGYDFFICQSWSKSRLGRSWVVPALDPERLVRPGQLVPYLRMLAAPLARDKQGNSEWSDPKVVAERVPLSPYNRQIDPLILIPMTVVPGVTAFLLLDGTTRSILFMRSEDPWEEVLVWVPATHINAVAE